MQARDRIADRYELTYPIGRGGMGQVWAGYDERLDRPVAVKFLRQMEVPEDERDVAVKRFRREARVTARLDHTGVPVIHDLGEHGEDLYIVMQLVRGIELADLIAEREQLSVGESTSIASQVCSVLATAHDASLVHRDLKPQNLMITPSGGVKVLDFGVAALLGPAEASRLTATGHTLGTPPYIAPEQAAGNPTGPAADLYALGCILFEMLTGRPPYEAKNAPDMLRRHIQAPIPVITEYRHDVPDDLAHLLYCLLAKKPTDRPGSASDVEQLLAPFHPETDQASTGSGRRTPPARTDGSIERIGPAVAGEPQQLEELRERGRELAEAERFAQAAEVLQQALLPTRAGLLEPQVIAVRMDLANVRMLAGDYRNARRDFDALAQDLGGPGGDLDLAQRCRQQALACDAELAFSPLPAPADLAD
ncbi:serine/threonine-protein kinase [Micromonospora sp. CB01531]|uniref:serine/threonine-protein kinase n=1 Tax=Micromonospora sp. CB01531 TaxID=1718947 RepID=UPI0009396E86|nr:serine/threonine-protein kinase [Micromonospora sp. CB01531]OKI61684.1 serine/threonine protein kinase [Micromonospora sp. CB01531]